MSSFKELNISNPGTSTTYGGNDTDLINKLFNGVVAGIPAVRIRSQNKFGFDDGILWIYNQALSKKTTIRGQSNAPTTDVDLRLPPITGNDVLPALNLEQAWLKKQQLNLGMSLQEMDTPTPPGVSLHHVYVGVDGHLRRINSGGAVKDYDIGATLSSTLFADQTLQLRNPLGTATLTVRNPAITSNADYRFNQAYAYLVWIEGTTIYVKNGATGATDSATGGTNGTTLLQTTFNALATTGGTIHFCAGIFPIFQQLTIPQHNGKSITIEGEGIHVTTLKWGNFADSAQYVIEAYSTLSTGWQAVTFKDLQILGGATVTDRRVHCLHLGRENSAANAHFNFYNVRIQYGITAQVVAHYLQSSFFYNFLCESYGATPADYPIIDMAIDNSSHVHVFGGVVGQVTIDQSRFEMFGGTMTNLEIKECADYITVLDTVFMDPPNVDSTGFTHQIQVGTTGSVIGAVLKNLTFSSDTHTPATDRYIKVLNAKNVYISQPNFSSASTVATYIEVTSSATATVIDWQNQQAITKIIDAGSKTVIRYPYVKNNIIISNPSGTSGANLTDDFTGNQLQLANTALHIVNTVRSSSASARWKVTSRNAANSADVTRLDIGNLQDQGLSAITYRENVIPSGGVSLQPFLKAGTPTDGDFLNPVNGLTALDTTNSLWYARVGGAWVLITNKAVTEILTNKTVDFASNTGLNALVNPFYNKKTGVVYLRGSTASSSGSLAGLVTNCISGTGAVSGNVNNATDGYGTNCDTGATINSITGWKGTLHTIRQVNPLLMFRFQLIATTDFRFYCGISSNASTNPTSTADYLNAVGGVGLWVDTAVSANWKIMHNNTTGASVVDDTSVPFDALSHTLQITAIDATPSFVVKLDGTTMTNGTVTGSDQPAQTLAIGFIIYMENIAAASKTFNYWKTWEQLDV
jgi:hypothetical protein